MRKATAWSVRGVDRSTQEIAEETARRAGMSLGDWLDTVVADKAADQGVATEELAEDDKLDAIGERLSRLARRDEGAGSRRGGDDVRPRDAQPPLDKASPEEARLARERLDAAIARFESRASKNEERTAKAFESVASWIERSQIDRREERETLQTVAQKLEAIESRAQRDAERLRATAAEQQQAREEAMQSQIDARLDALARRVAATERAPAPVAARRAQPEAAAAAPRREPDTLVETPAPNSSDVDGRLAELTRRVEAAERARAETNPPITRPKLDVREAVEQISKRRVEGAPRPRAQRRRSRRRRRGTVGGVLASMSSPPAHPSPPPDRRRPRRRKPRAYPSTRCASRWPYWRRGWRSCARRGQIGVRPPRRRPT